MALNDFYRGDTISLLMVDQDSADQTGFKYTLTLKASPTDSDENAALQYSATVDTASPDGYLFTIPHTETAIPVNSYFYDIQLVTPEPTVTTVDAGRVKVLQDITQSID